jgi:para-aminobenzoate synthetase/4-amino-4-deoxychorismate lyase
LDGVGGGPAPRPGSAIVQDGNRWLRFETPGRVLTAFSADEVRPALRDLDDATRGGLWAAGFVSYEAAAAFGFAVRPPEPGLPLVWFGLYREAVDATAPAVDDAPVAASTWEPALDPGAYARAFEALQERIARGDTYQVNFTFPLRAAFGADPWAFFRSLRLLQRGGHAAYVDTGRFVVCSASPELFFRWEGDRLVTRPMKGTARRGRTAAEDEACALALAASEKDRAENLMIVDMLRNDLGRVAVTASVEVTDLFTVERYPTLLQMTSTVEARSAAGIAEILAALFPCASVTGAPKTRTMEIIAETESAPRGVYTGAVGWVGPGRGACFNVAIRTAVLDRERGEARFGVGSGVVADSDPAREYAECLLKARVLAGPAFRLLETMRFSPEEGFVLEDAHVSRLLGSAAHFGAPVSRTRVEEELRGLACRLIGPSRVRLLVDLDGRIELQTTPLEAEAPRPLRAALAQSPVDDSSPWLFHKTTRRDVYDEALAAHPEADDVVLWNRRGEVTEACLHNVLVDLGHGPVTPPVTSGLLAGTFRGHLLATGQVREQVVTVAELRARPSFFLVNSVAGRCEAIWAEDETP